MVSRHYVAGYENFLKFVEGLTAEGPIFVVYTGAKLPNGKSWCPDCVEADPYIEKGLAGVPDNSHIVVVEVGDRAFWKDAKCPFRTNPKIKLNSLPTLARWGTQKRLEGDQCKQYDLIEILLTSEDD